MNKFDLHTFGLPSFGISDFRLTSFGGDGDGGRKAALPSPDLYYDLSLKSNEHPTRNIIDDMSGNGRHATIYNALYAKGSGYGKYAEDFMSWMYDITDSAGLEIEGRNLLRNSEIERHDSASGGEYLQIANIVSIYDKYGEGTYTFSFDAKSDVAGDMEFYAWPGTHDTFKYLFPLQGFQITTEYKRYTFTVDVYLQNPDATRAPICLFGEYGTGRKPWVKNVKVELGNKATPWTPAPEDQVSDLNIERTSEKVTIFANEAGVPQYYNFGNIGLKEFNISFKASVDCKLIVQTRKFGDSTLLQESTQIIADTLYHMNFETLDASEYAQRWVYFTSPIKYPLTITQIPEYEGAFVFDGIDDYASIGDITKGFKTLFMEVVPISINTILYDQRIRSADESDWTFAIYNPTAKVAYNELNTGGVTYINGNLNKTILADNLVGKRQVITIVNNTDISSKNGVLGADYEGRYPFSNMALYKVIGFYDELTPEQIQRVITKYNLKYEQI